MTLLLVLQPALVGQELGGLKSPSAPVLLLVKLHWANALCGMNKSAINLAHRAIRFLFILAS
jgi:hypothetical protein